MRAKLIGVPGSHPTTSAELMLRFKGIEFTRMDLPNMSHKAILPLLRYRGSTVPVITLEAKRISGTMRIARALEHFVPVPPLFPAEDRATIEGAEAWGDSVLQDGVRQLARYGAPRDPEAMPSFLARHPPGRGVPDADERGDRAHVPGGAAGPARPRRRAARRRRDRR
jgi:glutathione S-transferase